MAGFDSSRAIGAVSQLLKNHLTDRTTIYTTIGHPETASDGSSTRHNLFLYEASFDASMRSRTLDEQRPAPLWLSLRYLLTSYDGGVSDTIASHRSLGDAMRALQELAYLPITGLTDDRDTAALQANPEPLKITFVEASSELLGRVLQGSDERYRFSIAFEVRPVMIALAAPGEDALLVGVQYRPPGGDPRPPGVDIVLDPGLQVPTLARVAPVVVELGGSRSRMTLTGRGFGPGDLACIGPVELVIAESAGLLIADLVSPDRNGAAVPELISAGAHLLTVVRELTREGRVRRRTSNPQTVRILPVLTTATVADTVRDTMTPAADPRAVVTLELAGELLGTERDDVAVALWSAARTAASTDDVIDVPAAPPQTLRRAIVRNVPAGSYRVIVRVNGAQATASPLVDVVVPP